MATDSSGNQAVAFEWGNIPMQPNNDRTDTNIDRPGENNDTSWQSIPPALGPEGNHAINGVEWNSFPEFKGSRNYMVTAVEYLGGNVYEYTSENEIEVGEYVKVTGCDAYNTANQQVIYADATKFRTSDELGTGKLTGLYGRVDVNESGVGNTLEGGAAFYWPSNGMCYQNPKAPGGRWQDLIEYLRTCGVNPEFLTEATFENGDNKYDTNGDYVGGVIFWDYIPADEIMWVDWGTETVYTGKDFDGMVIANQYTWGEEVGNDSTDPLDYSFVAFTNDPAKGDTANWWY